MVRLRVILALDNIRRLDITEELTSVEQLKEILKEGVEIKNDFVIQFEDPDFGNELCNLTEITQLPSDRAVLKIIQKFSDSDADTISSLDTASMPSSSSSSAQNSPSVSVKQRGNSQWPPEFEIPEFAYDVELRLNRANKEFEENGKLLLTMSREMKIEILNSLAQKMFTFTAYPSIKQIEFVAAALIAKYPCLKDPGPGSGYNSWTMSIKFKMGNFREKLRSAGCSEVSVNRKRPRSVGSDSRCFKKAKRCEANFLPDNPNGQSDSSLLKEKEALCEEMRKKYPNMAFVESKMEITFSLRRKEIVMEEPLVLDVQRQWPALFLPEQISAEFFRITQTHLMNRFFSSLDEYAPKIIRLYRARAALWGKDMKTLLENLDDQTTEVLAHRKSAALRGLPLIMRDESKSFLRTCLDMQPRENHVGGMKMGVLTIVEDDVGTVDSIPNARFFTVVLEEQIVIDEVSDLPTAVALLFGLVYALNMAYPKELKYTFETIQKLFMCLDTKCSARVQSFKNKMLMY
ncbi:unnamed protein product [Knipowitschia caucasica]